MRLELIGTLLRGHFGIEGDLSPLPGENENYLISQHGEPRWVAKITGSDVPEADLELERLAAERVAAVVPGLRVARAIESDEGRTTAEVLAPGEPPCTLRVFGHLSGDAWCDLGDRSDALLEHLGETLAALSIGLSDLRHPRASRTHGWDLTRADSVRGQIALMTDPGRRRTADRLFHLWAGARERLDECPHGFIHGDVNNENLLVTDGRITGLLDFGDALHNPLVCDLAIALAYAMLGEAEPLERAALVVGAYHASRPLSECESELLFPLICGRLATTVTTAARRRREDPTRESWFATEQPAWDLIERLVGVSPREANARLLSHCDRASDSTESSDSIRDRRAARLGPSLSLSYDEPLHMVRGRGQFLYEASGEPFLDLVNNVCHVGHCHPHVVLAIQRQAATLNTNTRYLFPQLAELGDRLCATLPDPLSVCFFVNSGSEANELAIRLARRHTGRRDIGVIEGGYHGNTGTLVDVSHYKFAGPGGSGSAADWVHPVPTPDVYRGVFRGTGGDHGRRYVEAARDMWAEAPNGLGAFLAESVMSCAGQISPPAGYLAGVYEAARSRGAVCIADEVQTGFGRVGTHFWAFDSHGVVPDIVTMGKPMGNGHPVGAVVTTREIAASFANGMEYFNTFGGNPVSCAAALAVLDVIESEGLQARAMSSGALLVDGLQHLAERHAAIGDVRGQGLFLGFELVADRESRDPDARLARDLVNRVRRRGVLLSTDGPSNNVIKIKPPMVVRDQDLRMTLRILDEELTAASTG